MLCVVIAWLAQLLFLVYQSHVLKLRKATLFLWPSPEPLCNKKKNIHMATVQILAFITLDGYLARRTTFPDLWEHPDKYGITRIREGALSRLDPDVSFISLTEWKHGHSGVYLAEAALETLPLRTAFSALAWPTSWSCMSCPASRGKAPICSREVPGFLMGAGRDTEFRQGCLPPALQTGRWRVTAVSPPGCP